MSPTAPRSSEENRGRGLLGVTGIGLAVVLCCALLPLLAGGALAIAGAALGSPLLILVGAGVAGGAIAAAATSGRRGHRLDKSTPTQEGSSDVGSRP